MPTRTFSPTSLQILAGLPPAKRGPGYQTVSISTFSSSSSEASVEVPDELNSLEFLQFAGFEESVAQIIWEAWQNRGDREDWVIDDARYYIKQKAREHDAVDETEDWDSALQRMGLSVELRQRILNPQYDIIRAGQCACFWALDTVNEAFEFLSSLSERIEKKGAGVSRIDSPDETRRPRPASRGRRQHGEATSSSSQISPVPVFLSATQPPNIEGRTVLFKGGSEARLERCMNEDGTIRVASLHSSAPTDFHPEKGTYLYLTKYHDIALKYAQYVQERVPPSQGAVLHLAISENLLAHPREIFSQDWRDLIWHSRNTLVHESTFRQLPAYLQQFKDAEILVGQVCNDSTHKISRMDNKNELSVMRRPNGSPASQLVVQSIPLQIRIARDLQGFVWIVPV